MVVLNDQTFEERFSLKLSRLNVIILASSALILLVFFIGAMIVLTPLKEYIPGYADVGMRKELGELYVKTNDLQHELEAKEVYLANIHSIVTGTVGEMDSTSQQKNTQEYDASILDGISQSDSSMRAAMESENLDIQSGFVDESKLFKRLNFFTPVKGLISNAFSVEEEHFGVDIAASEGEPVKAILDGTILQATYSVETGYIMLIQHNNNLISAYKHNAALLKKVGTFVKAGEVIAVVGNSGEFTSGTHLHLEIWYNGTPVNPEDFIKLN